MEPTRKINIKGTKVEEFYWNGKYVVYVNNCLQDKSVTYESVVNLLQYPRSKQ